jgi:hypothetical protein
MLEGIKIYRSPPRSGTSRAPPARALSDLTVEAWRSGFAPISDQAARYVEHRLGLPPGWLDEDHAPEEERA